MNKNNLKKIDNKVNAQTNMLKKIDQKTQALAKNLNAGKQRRVRVPRAPVYSSRGDIFDQLVSARGLTPAGRDWLIAAVDPFHDYDYKCNGYPDQSTARTITLTYTKEVPITHPPGLADGSTWDCQLQFMPFDYKGSGDPALMQLASKTTSNTMAYTTPALYLHTGLLHYWTVPNGNATYFNTLNTTSNSLNAAVSFMDVPGSNARLIGAAFEVTNTTSELYKQGSVRVYRNAWNRSLTDSYIQTASSVCSPATFCNGVINSVTEAANCVGSAEWEAIHGVYVQGTFDTTELPLSQQTLYPHILGDTSSGVVGKCYISGANNTAQSGTNTALFRRTNLNQSGAYFTGLSKQTSLTLVVKYTVEFQPNPDDSNGSLFQALAQVSPAYDAMALTLYNQIAVRIPAGCKKGDNDAGDFFRRVLGIVAKVASPVASVLGFIPGLQEFAPIAAGVGEMAARGEKALADRKKPKPV